jgi:hypothetical protein
MRIFGRHGFVLAIPLVVAAALALGSPARAGDDCFTTKHPPWTVTDDFGCDKDIFRTILSSDNKRSVYVNFLFFSAPAQGARHLTISPFPRTASGVTVKVPGRRALQAAASGTLFQLPAAEANQVIASLRRRQAVLITVSYPGGVRHSYSLDGTNFEAAYQQLIR